MPTQVIGRVVSAPTGWAWSNGILQPTGEFNATTFDALYKWAKQKKYGLEPQIDSPQDIYSGGFFFSNVICTYKVYQDSWELTKRWLGEGVWSHKKESSNKHSLGRISVLLNGVEYWNSCSYCERKGLARCTTRDSSGSLWLCPVCSTPCSTEGCEEWVNKHFRLKGDKTKCSKCYPRVRCYFCKWYTSKDKAEEFSDKFFACTECAADRRCSSCNKITQLPLKALKGRHICGNCYADEFDKERIPHEAFAPDELPVGGSLRLGNLPNRPVRVLSIETEVNGDPTALANTLYNCGLVREPFVESYGSRVPEESTWPAFLKYDGSVTGGELINYLLKLDTDEHAESLKNVLSKMRSLEKLGKVDFAFNCGGHVHIDAHNYSSDNVWRLLTGYNYLEDVIYRLAGAGHKYGHRTLVPGHDSANGGRGYSVNTVKGPWGVKSGAFRAIANQDRMTGLNFQPYLQAANYCRCGSGAENLRSCTCTLPKCTIEWRVWNTQGNPRILHGWLAFMLSLHAWADTPKEMTKAEEEEYPVLAWDRIPWKSLKSARQKEVLGRVEWIFQNLVFTDEEKDSLLYAFDKTDIQFPDGFLNDLRALPAPKNRSVKAPRNCTLRQAVIRVSPPDEKVFGKFNSYARRR